MLRFVMLAGLVFLSVAVAMLLLAKTIPTGTVTSWWRGPKKNRDVGGVRNSAHLFGLAVDVAPDTDLVYWAARRLPFRFVLREGTHIHMGLW
jgi:hypothetical protein